MYRVATIAVLFLKFAEGLRVLHVCHYLCVFILLLLLLLLFYIKDIINSFDVFKHMLHFI